MPLAGEWDYASIAELSPAQQRKLAGLWFGAVRDAAGPGPGPGAQKGPGLDDFIAEVEGKAELRQLAATPLFLLLLVGLRLSGVPLPGRRFEVYEAVVSQLLEDHPAARAAAARVAIEDGGLPADDVRQALAHLAFQWQERGEFTPVPDNTVRAGLVAALKDPGHLAMDAQSAARMARTLTEIAEGQLGVLVRYGNKDLGFLHRVFLEELAAEHAADQLPAGTCSPGVPAIRAGARCSSAFCGVPGGQPKTAIVSRSSPIRPTKADRDH
jgi:AcrR family transcriptional regulator